MSARASSLRPAFAVACALGLALASWGREAAADDLVPSISVQTGATITRSPGNNTNDYFVAATPQLIYFVEGERNLFSLTYSVTASLNTELPNGLANRLAAAFVRDLTPRTRLVLGAEALQALIGNYLLVRRAASTQIGAIPALNTSLLTTSVSQAVTHEISPVVRLNQTLGGTYVTSIDPDVQLRNYLATATVGIDRSWEFDAVGGELGVQYARTFFPPIPASQAFTVSLGPTWDHDVSTTVSTSLSVSAQAAFSPDAGTKARVAPAGRASILYSSEGSGIGLEYAGGIEPNLLLGTLLQSQQVTLRGFTPLSERLGIVLGVSSGFLHAKNLDLSGTGAFDNEFDAVLHDADVTWAATEYLSMFVRYQFIGQASGDGPGATPAIVRHGALFGIDLFAARPPPRQRLPSGRLPQRVDRSDSQQLGRSSSGSSRGLSSPTSR